MSELEPQLFLVEPSEIEDAGVGCFAASAISKHSRLMTGVTAGGTRQLGLNEIPDAYLKFCPLLESGLYFAPANFAAMSVFWYINHAREPNLEMVGTKLFAAHDIEPGEEITMYYLDLLTHPKNQLWVKPEHI